MRGCEVGATVALRASVRHTVRHTEAVTAKLQPCPHLTSLVQRRLALIVEHPAGQYAAIQPAGGQICGMSPG